MTEEKNINHNKLDIVILFRVLAKSWKLIFAITSISFCASVFYAMTAREVYRSEILLSAVEPEQPSIASGFGNMGGLAALTGISIPADSDEIEVLATIQSRKFINRFLSDRNATGHERLKILFSEYWDNSNQNWTYENGKPPTQEMAFNAFSQVMDLKKESRTGLIRLSMYWVDPEVCSAWANDIVEMLNDEMKTKAQDNSRKRIGYLKEELAKTKNNEMQDVLYEILKSEERTSMLANVNEEFALKVIDPAVVPENRAKPNRKLVVLLGAVFGFCTSLLMVFLIYFFQGLKAE